MGAYKDEITRAMTWIGEQEHSLLIGQTVAFEGTNIFPTVSGVPSSKRYEFSVNEAMQMGVSIGLALNGYNVVSIYPRWNFALLAIDQIVNHLDKIPLYTDYRPKVIIRTVVGSENPMWPGHQHVGDFTDALRLMCQTINVIRLDEPEQIFSAYKYAYERQDGVSSLLVEVGDHYNEK